MRRYMLNLSYIGTSYNGSQRLSSNKILDIDTVQGAVESSLIEIKKLIINDVNLVMAEQTDIGIHALCTAAHIDLKFKSVCKIDSKQQLHLINKSLNKCDHKIRIFSFYEVSKKFHAIFSAKYKEYLYRFLIAKNPENGQIPISELRRTLNVHTYGKDFDFERMKNGINLFKCTQDFKPVNNQNSLKIKFNNENHNKNNFGILDIDLKESKPLMPCDPLSENFYYWNLIFKSNFSLYNKIRQVIGTLMALGYNNLSEEDILQMLQVPLHHNWNLNVKLAPPYGLYILNVKYDKAEIQDISNIN